MSDDLPTQNTATNPDTAPTDQSDTGGEQAGFYSHDSDDGQSNARQSTNHKNVRSYGHANMVIGVVAVFINAVLVVVLMIQTWAVHGQLELSGKALESSNQGFQRTLAEMRDQSSAMSAQVKSLELLTSTLGQVFRDQQRARISFRVALDQIDDVQIGTRIVCPIEIGGNTEALKVHFKNFISAGTPRQLQFLDTLTLDWKKRKSHPLPDISPTEVGRRFVTPVLSQTCMKTILSKEKSIYFVGRLEYCDVYGACRYFMRCAELGHQPGVISYCGTRIGNLERDRKD